MRRNHKRAGRGQRIFQRSRKLNCTIVFLLQAPDKLASPQTHQSIIGRGSFCFERVSGRSQEACFKARVTTGCAAQVPMRQVIRPKQERGSLRNPKRKVKRVQTEKDAREGGRESGQLPKFNRINGMESEQHAHFCQTIHYKAAHATPYSLFLCNCMRVASCQISGWLNVSRKSREIWANAGC